MTETSDASFRKPSHPASNRVPGLTPGEAYTFLALSTSSSRHEERAWKLVFLMLFFWSAQTFLILAGISGSDGGTKTLIRLVGLVGLVICIMAMVAIKQLDSALKDVRQIAVRSINEAEAIFTDD